jgi:2-iminobutanoate/2-iminopropanoate deaminase
LDLETQAFADFEDHSFLREDHVTRINAPLQTALLGMLLLAACQAPSPPSQPVTREAIQSQLPNRPYSRAVRVGNTYYFSGALGVNDETLAMEEGRIEAETHNVMEGFKELFAEVGVEFADVVKGTVYLADVSDYAGMNQVYGEYFLQNPPARECIAAGQILSDALVEISFVAVVQ